MRESETITNIVTTLMPSLVQGARYSRLIQSRIEALEDKDGANIFAVALSDADICVQNHIEVALLAHYPEIPFFGEEWKSSRNTKYLAGNAFQEGKPYLITLDPIDGTRPYLDGHDIYHIILTVVSRSSMEASLTLFPSYDEYVFARKGEGAIRGTLGTPLSEATELRMGRDLPRNIYLGGEFHGKKHHLEAIFDTVLCPSDYLREKEMIFFSGLLRGNLCAGALESAQIIDGAALAFAAREMGFVVRMLDGSQLPSPEHYPDMIFPGLIVAESEEMWQKLHSILVK